MPLESRSPSPADVADAQEFLLDAEGARGFLRALPGGRGCRLPSAGCAGPVSPPGGALLRLLPSPWPLSREEDAAHLLASARAKLGQRRARAEAARRDREHARGLAERAREKAVRDGARREKALHPAWHLREAALASRRRGERGLGGYDAVRAPLVTALNAGWGGPSGRAALLELDAVPMFPGVSLVWRPSAALRRNLARSVGEAFRALGLRA